MSAGERKKPSVFEQIKSGLDDSIAYSRGELSLVTTDLPAPPPKARPRDIAALRKRLRMSQAVFAAMLNVSPKTVQSWEQGIREPSDVALRMLQVIRERPQVVRMIIGTAGAPRRSTVAAASTGFKVAGRSRRPAAKTVS